MKTGFVYIWFDRKHKRYYIGSHWGTEDDGYICSSTWMKNAFKRRPHDFRRKILTKNLATKEEMFQEEHRWQQYIKSEELGKRYYNLNKNPLFHWTSLDSFQTTRQKLSETMKLKHQDPEYQRIYMEGRSKAAKSNKGKQRSESFKKHISEVHSNRSEKTREKIRQNNIRLQSEGRIGMTGKKHSEETKAKQSEAAKRRPILQCPHCLKTMNMVTTFNRWHGNNCKHINTAA